ncbi:adenylylsulfate kinase [Leptolyngbya sp. Heron Island J]|uniref:bifunctional aminoglycoside phosphotransferase/ATP-binding protein n=1 Tax=Leptolyngbya sp. Heron Island J TaxID=1385935 RepID=UPI0003B9BBC5|nr:bifunctional aminoglycoside phosphotransferase/ATP-binding protein [Leptolyngbya sp. Heron Island J]ESA35719.1 adenylylsulfate kinase [Leptolyngbya sp. Heron Island J]
MVSQVLPPLIEHMLRSSFYPHWTQDPIELIQTHTAYVLLTGDYAYKVKKPVNYGFLDYSTVAARKHFVEEELRLNRRTAEELYLAAVPIYQVGTTFSLLGQGEPVDYAVKMKQFPAGALFSDLLAQGQLTPALMQALAHQVAEFHQRAAVSDRSQFFGTIPQIRAAFDQNYTQTQAYIGRGQTQQQLQETQAYTDRIFTEWPEQFQTRINHHKIRECHGDLHLRNICLWHNRIFLFDCIEFNDAFRHVDTLYDVAFTVMDCDARGRADLGNIFLNTYLEDTADWEGVELLPLYLSRQAYTRAKVTSFLLDQPSLSPQQQHTLQTEAQAYYTLAWHYTQRPRGRLILMSGLSGTGKSTVARRLAQRLRAIHIRSDAVRKHLAGLPLQQRGAASLYTSTMTQQTYDRLWKLGIHLASQGHTVILDAKYDRVATRQIVLAQAKAANIPVTILVCHAPLTVLRQRLQQRTGDIADATVELLSRQQVTAEPLTADEQLLAIDLDTSAGVDDDQLQAVANGCIGCDS